MQREAKTYINAHTEVPELCLFASGTAGVYSAPCPPMDRPNEDACALVSTGLDSGILVLADGMGGGQQGHEAARVAVEKLAESAAADLNDDTIVRTVILNAFENANTAVQGLAGAATTMVAVEIERDSIRPYNVGDSSVLVIGGRGKVKHQSIAHSPTGYGIEGGFLNEEEALQHDERHVVSNMIGMPEMHIEVGPRIALAKRDTVVLASDGLTDNLHVTEIAELARLRPLSFAMATLAERATTRMIEPVAAKPSKPDDLTFLLFRLS